MTLTPLTAQQIASPSSEVLLDLTAIVQLNSSPYTLYVSNGFALVPLIGASDVAAQVAAYLMGLPVGIGNTTGPNQLYWNGATVVNGLPSGGQLAVS